MPVFHSFAQVREDLQKYTTDLPAEVVWREVDGASLGFHLKHIAGSVDRLTTYLLGGQLSEEQLRALKSESKLKGSLQDLLSEVDGALTKAEQQIQRELNPANIYDNRSVGRRALPTTVIGLLVHLCEHTQRHLGQAITIAKMLRQP